MTMQSTGWTTRPGSGDSMHCILLSCVCQNCYKPTGAWLDGTHKYLKNPFTDVKHIHANAGDATQFGWHLVETFPKRFARAAPAFVPDGVARIYLNAKTSQDLGLKDAAASSFGKALDTATRRLNDTDNLHQRIRELAAAGQLTAELAGFLQELRVIRNFYTHEEAEPTSEDVADVGEATELVLSYLFTLPGRLAAIKQRHAEAEAKATNPS
jgi:predicted DNA-binding protein with PD1-like motif